MSKAISFSMFENIAVGLFNCCKCQNCNNIIHYNGFMPRCCHVCAEKYLAFDHELMDDLKFAKTQVIK